MIQPYNNLEDKEEKNKYISTHSELEEVMEILESIEQYNVKSLVESRYYRYAMEIKEWMLKKEASKSSKQKSEDIKENKLARKLADIRHSLIKPYNELKSEEEKEKYKFDHPELEEVLKIIKWIDENNVKEDKIYNVGKEDRIYYKNILEIKEWMRRNGATRPPRPQYKSKKTGENAVPEEEARLAYKLYCIRTELVKPYNELKNQDEKDGYKIQHPELEDVLKIVEEIDNRIPEKLQQAREIKCWMQKYQKIKPPRATIKISNKALKLEEMNDIQKEEYLLGNALRRIRVYLIEPYKKIGSQEERDEYKNNNPELEEVMELVSWIDSQQRTNIAQDIGKASYDAPTVGCDEKQEFMQGLERTIKERGRAS